jgi:rhodanese-related sulfurtransferase
MILRMVLRRPIPLVIVIALFAASTAGAAPDSTVSRPPTVTPILPPSNPAIDMNSYLKVSQEAAAARVKHRVSEADFIRMSREPGTVILDARSREKYDMLHVKGAINLSFPDIAIESLAKAIPDKRTKVLIYCNNNFRNAPGPFPSKLASASLNLSTFIALYNYGYRNVYELGPTLDIHETRLEFEPPLPAR